jgi:hypothetical protein
MHLFARHVTFKMIYLISFREAPISQIYQAKTQILTSLNFYLVKPKFNVYDLRHSWQ